MFSSTVNFGGGGLSFLDRDWSYSNSLNFCGSLRDGCLLWRLLAGAGGYESEGAGQRGNP